MKTFIKENWNLFLPIVPILSPFYLSILRLSLEINGFKIENQELLGFSFGLAALILIIQFFRVAGR